MSWAQQREQIRRAAGAGVRPLGSQLLPLRRPGSQSAQLSRLNGALTRVGQFYYQLVAAAAQQAVRRGPAAHSRGALGLRPAAASRSSCARWRRTETTTSRSWARPSSRTSTRSGWPTCRSAFGDAARTAGPTREDYLPVTSLNVGLQRQNDGLSEAQVARNVKQAVLAKLGVDDDGAFSTVLELSDEQYFLDNTTREWTLSSQTTQAVDDRVVVETSLRQPLGALREVSYQLWKGHEILDSAFERRSDKLCVPRQLAELPKLPLAEVLSDFDAICERGWQERGVSPKQIREFCVWRGAPMFFVNCRGQLMDSYQPLKGGQGGGLHRLGWTCLLPSREVRPPPAQVAGGATREHLAGVRPVSGVGRRAPGGDSGPAQGEGGSALGGPLPHEEPVRVEGLAALGRRGGRRCRRLRHQRTA